MAKTKDDILVKMFDYLDHAKKILQEDGYLQPTVFAHSRVHDGIIVLPIVNEDGESPELALDLVGKVIRAYNVLEYFVVSESYHITGETSQECINIIYVGLHEKRLISVPFKRLTNGEFFLGEAVEILPTNIEGSVLELFLLRDRTPRITEREKEYIRIMFPAQSDDEIIAANHTLH